MPQSWTFGKKLAAGTAMCAITLLAVALFGYQSASRYIERSKWVMHTFEVRSELNELMKLLLDAETSQRGYVISGEDSFLDPYREALPQINKRVADLRRMTADNPQQQRNCEILKPLIDARLTVLQERIDERTNHGLEVAVKSIQNLTGKKLMDQIRHVIGEMDHIEHTLLMQRQAAAEEDAMKTRSSILWGTGIGLGLIVLVGLLIARSLGSQVGSAVRHMQSSSAELQAAANQQASGAKEQATAMNEMTTTITELLTTSRQIAESAQRVAQIAEQTEALARAGDETVARGSESVAGIRNQVDIIVSHMLDLGKKSQQIGGVLDIVAELAEQTNILAINATIEATGAGETGKRFAVVADEIRKLADRVTSSAKQIRGLIDEIRSSVNKTVMTTETGSKAAEAGARQFADVTGVFKQIKGQVITATEAAKEIGLSTKQQATAVEQVNLAITNVAQSAREAAVSTGQTLQTAAELAELSRELLRIVEPDARKAPIHEPARAAA